MVVSGFEWFPGAFPEREWRPPIREPFRGPLGEPFWEPFPKMVASNRTYFGAGVGVGMLRGWFKKSTEKNH